MFLIACYAVSTNAVSQNGSEVAVEGKQMEQVERDRIKRERAAATQELAEQRKACYQKLAVTPCLNEARDQHSEKTRDLKRQEVALNDVTRKRAAAERLQVIDKRNSPEAQLEQAERRGKALQASQKRDTTRVDRQLSREAKQAQQAAKTPAQSASGDVTSTPKQASHPAHKPRDPQLTSEQRAKEAARAAQRREQAAKREKDSLANQQKLQQREAQRKKPPASGLSIPN